MAPYNPPYEGELESVRDDGSVYGVLRSNNEKSAPVSTSTLEVLVGGFSLTVSSLSLRSRSSSLAHFSLSGATPS